MPAESQLQDTALRLRVRELLKDGRLPLMVPMRVDGSYGCDQSCLVCDQPITTADVQYEVDDYRDGKRLCFHLICHVVWQTECVGARRVSEVSRSDGGAPDMWRLPCTSNMSAPWTLPRGPT